MTTNNQLRVWVLENINSSDRFLGLCKMRVDSMFVVDLKLRVYRIESFHVADGSVNTLNQ